MFYKFTGRLLFNIYFLNIVSIIFTYGCILNIFKEKNNFRNNSSKDLYLNEYVIYFGRDLTGNKFTATFICKVTVIL